MLKTIFTSCHNQGEFLAEAIESVLAQTDGDFEYLLYDDGSTDDTWEIICDFSWHDRRIRAFRLDKQPNVGVVINKSIREMKGEAWVWLPSDDVLMPTLLEEKTRVSADYPDYVLYNAWEAIDVRGNTLYVRHPRVDLSESLKQAVWQGSPIGFTGIYIPRSAFQKAGLFPEHLDYSEDFYWLVKSVSLGIPYGYVPLILHKKRRHANTLTAANSRNLRGRMELIWEELKDLRPAVPSRRVCLA